MICAISSVKSVSFYGAAPLNLNKCITLSLSIIPLISNDLTKINPLKKSIIIKINHSTPPPKGIDIFEKSIVISVTVTTESAQVIKVNWTNIILLSINNRKD